MASYLHQLPVAGAAADGDTLHLSQGGQDKQVSVATLRAHGLRRKVAVPGTSVTAGAVGDYALSATHIYLYTGDGTTHGWLQIAGANEFP